MNNIEAIIFDFDSTLVDSLPLHCKSYIEAFKFFNLNLTEETYYKYIGSTSNNTIPLFLGDQKSPVSIEELHQKKLEISLQLLEDSVIAPLQPAKMLEFGNKFKFAIASAGQRAFILPILKRLKWTKYFDVILDATSVTNGKPAPDQLLLAAKMMGLLPEQCMYVGDSWADKEAAKAANMLFWDCSQKVAY